MYLRPRIIPCLSINTQHDLIKTVNFKNPRYLGDPINAVKIFNEKGVDELCILDIAASQENRGPMFDYLKDIASEAFMPLSYGGGITDLNQIKHIFQLGYEKVIINTAFYTTPDLITQAANHAGSQSIVVSIDVKNEFLGKRSCYMCDGTKKIKMTPMEAAQKAEMLGAGEILLNSINNDGTMQGYDIDLIKSIGNAVHIPVIACGGAKNIDDLAKALHIGNAHAVSAGSLFVYYGDEKAVLITVPSESELINAGIYKG